MSDRLLKESDVLKIVLQLPLVVNSAFADAVKALPSADVPTTMTGVIDAIREAEYRGYMKAVEDRPQGEWIYCEDYVGHDGYKCSNCGFFVPWAYDFYADSNFILNYHTCPHCDARMKGADDDI